MIEINLLPESMRKAEATPLPRLLTTYIGIALFCTLAWVNVQYMFFLIPKAQDEVKDKKAYLSKKAQEAKELDELEDQIAEIGAHVESVKQLYRERVIWAKLLWDLKQIVNFDPAMAKSNPERRYLWLDGLKLGKMNKATGVRVLEFSAYAAALDSNTAGQMIRRFISELQSYQSVQPPEKHVRQKVEETIRKLKAELARQREEQGADKVPETTPELEAMEKQLETITDRESGRIAYKKFSEFFIKDSINYDNVKWSGAKKLPEDNIPGTYNKFDVEMWLAPPPSPPVAGKKRK